MKLFNRLMLFCIILFYAVSLTAQSNEKADLILKNGNIFTLDNSKPSVQAAAVKGDKILAIGTNKEIEAYRGKQTRVIDLKGKFVMPGFFDSHAHFWGLGEFKKNLDLMSAKNMDEIIALVKKAAAKAKPGEWILGRGWHQEKWNKAPVPNVNGFPVNDILSKIAPNNPVMLKHASGHAIFVNAKALQLAGITKATPDPDGGTIMRDPAGNPTGVLHENAADPVTAAYNKYLSARSEEKVKADEMEKLFLASKECLEKGITSFEDAGSTYKQVDILKYAADNNKLPIRLNIMLMESNGALASKIKDYKIIGYGNNHLTVRAIKAYIDGALGSRSALLLEPYSDMPAQTGLLVTPLSELKERAEIAEKYGFQFCIHAIGDKANREVLNLYENIFKKYAGIKDFRWRIEHAQHLSLQDIERFGRFGIIAAMQPCHCTSDAVYVYKRLGEKRAEEGAYVWQKLMKSGALVCSGTDAPVEPVDPIRNFYSAVTRKYDGGKEFFPEQKMSRVEAIKSYTTNSAYAAFQEEIIGKLSAGYLADMVVLSNDLVNCKEEDILKTKVLYTIVGGKVLYSKK